MASGVEDSDRDTRPEAEEEEAREEAEVQPAGSDEPAGSPEADAEVRAEGTREAEPESAEPEPEPESEPKPEPVSAESEPEPEPEPEPESEPQPVSAESEPEPEPEPEPAQAAEAPQPATAEPEPEPVQAVETPQPPQPEPEPEPVAAEAPAEPPPEAPEPPAEPIEPAVAAEAAPAEGEAEAGHNGGDAAPKPSRPDYKWYILQTYSGYENRVRRTLEEKLRIDGMEELVEEIFVPGEDVTRVKGGRKRKQHVVYFPGYVLIKMKLTDELWHVLMGIPRVSGFVGGTNREPQPLDEAELHAIHAQMDEGITHPALTQEFNVGEQVVVIDGPFANFGGKIDEVNNEKRKVRVLISILGRSTPVELDFDKVKAQTD